MAKNGSKDSRINDFLILIFAVLCTALIAADFCTNIIEVL